VVVLSLAGALPFLLRDRPVRNRTKVDEETAQAGAPTKAPRSLVDGPLPKVELPPRRQNVHPSSVPGAV